MLCPPCSQSMYTADIGSCKECGSFTSSGAFKLCRLCSNRLDQCEHCRCNLTKAAEEERLKQLDPSRKFKFLVSINFDHYRKTEQKSSHTSREKMLKENREFAAQFQSEFKAWLRKKRLVRKVQVLSELPNLGMIVVYCTKDVAEKVKKAPGVASISGFFDKSA